MSIRQMFPGSIVKPGFDPLAAQTASYTYYLNSWGVNSSGQLGLGNTVSKSSPNQVGSLTTWLTIASGLNSILAVKTDGTLWAWGSNAYGQLGDNTVLRKSSPVQTITRGNNWKQVSCGDTHTVAVKTNGTLWSWGDNSSGKLGDNTTAARRSSPVQTVAFGTNWKQVSAGYYSTAAIKTDGTLWAWGYNAGGQLGDNTTTNRSSPVQTILYGTTWKSVACGYRFTAAIKDGDF